MVVAIGVAAGTAQRTLAGDFDREVGPASRENLAPGADDAFHRSTLAQGAGPRHRAKGRDHRPLARRVRDYFDATNIISTRPSAPTRPVFTVARAGKSLAMAAR